MKPFRVFRAPLQDPNTSTVSAFIVKPFSRFSCARFTRQRSRDWPSPRWSLT
ncbi:hypothetical protein ABLN72_10270 [Mycobacterium tuberculosis]